jgi:Spherulation-specific family 4
LKPLFATLVCVFALAAAAAPLGLMVPAYFYPGTSNYWGALDYAAARVPLIVILNPDSGPGAALDPNYTAAVTNVHRAGGQLIGYVATGYTTSNLVTGVEASINRYLSYYAVDGFFLDEMANDADTNHLNYYATLYQYIKGKNPRFIVAGNPGTDTQETYLTRPTADPLMTYEDEATNYPGHVMSGWVTNHLARSFVHVAYGVTSAAAMSNAVSLAVSRNAGWVFFTDDNLPNPYDTLPAYWTNEVALVQGLNAAMPATHVALAGVTNQVPTLKILGAPGAYEIQATTNFSNWTALQVLNTPTGTGTVADATATGRPASFYRTRQ